MVTVRPAPGPGTKSLPAERRSLPPLPTAIPLHSAHSTNPRACLPSLAQDKSPTASTAHYPYTPHRNTPTAEGYFPPRRACLKPPAKTVSSSGGDCFDCGCTVGTAIVSFHPVSAHLLLL